MGIRTRINNSLSSSSSSTEFELELELELDAFLDRIGGSWIVDGGITSVSRSDPVPQPISRTWLLALFYMNLSESLFSSPSPISNLLISIPSRPDRECEKRQNRVERTREIEMR
jgi:hypothetical protein